MIELLNPALAAGLLAAAAPLAIHIAHRRRARPVGWGAMRFLAELLTARRHRLALERWLLLALRTAALLTLALALCRPVLVLAAPPGAALTRSGAVAAVLIIDDSQSSGAGRDEPALAAVRRLAHAYLAGLREGDEISVLIRSSLGQPAADPLFDRAAAAALIDAVQPTAVASDMPALIEAGLAQFARHLNPSAELVLCSDGCRDGWDSDDRARWNDLRRRLGGGARGRPALIVLDPAPGASAANLAVASVRLDRGLVPAGRPVGIRVEVAHYGRAPVPKALLRLAVDGRVVGERTVAVGAGGRQEFAFTHTFPLPGSAVIEAALDGAHDVLPADDRRALAVEVERSVPVLLVEGTPPPPGDPLAGSLGLAAAALDPGGTGGDLFKVDRIAPADLAEHDLRGCRVVVLGDLPGLDRAGVAAIEAFIVAGGGVLVAPGPRTDLELANRHWARGGHGFLPAAFAELAVPDRPALPGSAALGHIAFVAFPARASEAWRDARVFRYVRLDPVQARSAEVQRLLTLDNGDALVVERRRGMGKVVLITTSLDRSWTDLPAQAAYVPLLRGLVSYLGSVVLPPRNLRPGERIVYCPGARPGTAALAGPDGGALPLTEDTWEGQRALLSEPLAIPGGYVLDERSGERRTRFAVAPVPAESRLEPLRDDDLRAALGDLVVHRYSTADHIAAATSGERPAVELWPWLVVACVALLLAETWWCRALARAERVVAG